MWMWLLYALGGLVGLVVLLAGIGLFLPRDHIAARRAAFHQPPETVWKAIVDVEQAPQWRSDLTGIERLPDREGRPVWVEVGKHGRMTMERIEADAPRKMVTRIADEDLPFGGTWTFEIVPTAEGCTLTLTERGFVKNPVFRTLGRFVFGYTATMEGYLKALGRKYGEEVTPVEPQ